MKETLFYSFIAIFVITSFVTILGITNVIKIDEKYLRRLFSVLLLELISAVVTLFMSADFFSENKAESVDWEDHLSAIMNDREYSGDIESLMALDSKQAFGKLDQVTESVTELDVTEINRRIKYAPNNYHNWNHDPTTIGLEVYNINRHKSESPREHWYNSIGNHLNISITPGPGEFSQSLMLTIEERNYMDDSCIGYRYRIWIRQVTDSDSRQIWKVQRILHAYICYRNRSLFYSADLCP